MRTEFELARTKAERRRVFAALAHNFDRWNNMTDQQLREEARKIFPALSDPSDRGMPLKHLTLHHLDQID